MDNVICHNASHDDNSNIFKLFWGFEWHLCKMIDFAIVIMRQVRKNECKKVENSNPSYESSHKCPENHVFKWI